MQPVSTISAAPAMAAIEIGNQPSPTTTTTAIINKAASGAFFRRGGGCTSSANTKKSRASASWRSFSRRPKTSKASPKRKVSSRKLKRIGLPARSKAKTLKPYLPRKSSWRSDLPARVVCGERITSTMPIWSLSISIERGTARWSISKFCKPRNAAKSSSRPLTISVSPGKICSCARGIRCVLPSRIMPITPRP